MSNLRQLQVCWTMYADDYGGVLCQRLDRLRWWRGGGDFTQNSWSLGNARVDTTTDNIKKGLLFL